MPRRIATVRESLHRSASRIEIHQVEGEFSSGLARLIGRLGPVGGVQSRDARRRTLGTHVLCHPVDLLDRDVEAISLRVLEHQIVTLLAEDLFSLECCEERDSMGGMNHIVARCEAEGHARRIHLTDRPAGCR